MATFWEEIRKQVVEHTTSADVSSMIYQKLASTDVQGPAIIRPAFYLGQVSVLTMDFMDHVERLQESGDRDWAGALKTICFLRECGRSLVYNITQASEPVERLITMVEEILEGEEYAAMEDEEEEPEPEEPGSVETASAAVEEADEELDDGVDREELTADKEQLEESLRVQFRQGGFSDPVCEQLAAAIASVYLECVQFARELARLSKAPEEDTATIMSILIDLQYGLDSQLRGLLIEDINTNDVEPTFQIGFFTWSSHLLSELMEKVGGGEATELVAAGE